MFEKEAEEYFETECLHSYADTEEQLKEDVVPAFQKGAEFGYNKAKEEDKWHDLRNNPNDLPTKERLGETFIVAFAFNEKTQKYYSFDCAEYIDKGKFITHTVNADNENNSYKVIAWKEITQPKELENV